MLAITDMDGFCAASVPGLAAMARATVEETVEALRVLESPDKYSRTSAQDGRRIQKVEGGWVLINHSVYRDRERSEKRREYMKTFMAKRRASDDLLAANKANKKLTPANPSASVSASPSSPEGSAEGEYSADFNTFWQEYPRKVGKGKAWESWSKAKGRPAIANILAAVIEQKASPQWMKEAGQFIPHPSTWLNQRRWDDKPTVALPNNGDKGQGWH